jgi:hypothetical protein
MTQFVNHPLMVFVWSLATLWSCALIGATVLRRYGSLDESLRQDFGVVLTASLTLLALIIGFTFSMAINRYDLRKNYEETEANAISTEYLRLDFLGASDAAKAKGTLRSYTSERIRFYATTDSAELRRIASTRDTLKNELWSAIRGPAPLQPAPISALIISGMNDVLNSEGYTQASWWNRIPVAAWCLLGFISILCNLMLGYGTQKVKARSVLLAILPLLVSISLFLIADIDSPRGGVIRVAPLNLISALESMPALSMAGEPGPPDQYK